MYETCKMTRVKKGALDQPSNILPTKETTIQLNYIQLAHIQIHRTFNEKEVKCLLGTIFILRKDIGVGGPENGNFPLLYVVKMSLRRWVGGSK